MTEQLSNQQIASSSKWALLGNILPRLFVPVFNIILANLLEPADYGIVGIASMTVSFMGIIQNAGMGDAVIQQQKRELEFANVAFWINLFICLLIFGLMITFAGYWGAFFNEPRVIPVLRVMALQLLGMGISIVPMALLRKRFQFRRILRINVSIIFISFVVSLPLAFWGAGYWALAIGSVLGSFGTAVLAWWFSGWRPIWSFDQLLVRSALSFGLFVLLENLLGWIGINIDRIIVGKFLTPSDFGIYILAFNLSFSLCDTVLGGLRGVFLPTLSMVQSDRETLRKLFTDMTHCIMVLVVPISFGLSMVADPLTDIIYGTKWQGLDIPLSLIVLYVGIGQFWGLNSDAYKAIGRPDISPKYNAILLIFLSVVFLIFVRYGLIVFCLARVGAVLCTGVVHTMIAQKVLGLPWNYSVKVLWTPVAAGILMAFAVWLVKIAWWGDYHSVQALASMVVVGGMTYCWLIWLIDRRTAQFFLKQVKITLLKIPKN